MPSTDLVLLRIFFFNLKEWKQIFERAVKQLQNCIPHKWGNLNVISMASGPVETAPMCVCSAYSTCSCIRLVTYGSQQCCHFVSFSSGWHVVLLVFLVKVFSHVWRRPLHEDPIVHKSSPCLRRGHLPGAAHRRGSLQHTALPR